MLLLDGDLVSSGVCTALGFVTRVANTKVSSHKGRILYRCLSLRGIKLKTSPLFERSGMHP
jgi:hypothetical protein